MKYKMPTKSDLKGRSSTMSNAFAISITPYRDGTYILEDGTYRRLQDYSIEPLEFTVANDIKFSCKWRVKLPGYKEEDYHIVPLAEGQINLAYFELLAGVYNQDGKLCGYCFVELLPGVYNKKIPIALTKTV